MKFSIKNWIIKKLGGYTKDEYDKMYFEMNLKVRNIKYIRLKSTFVADFYQFKDHINDLNKEYIQEKLAEKFLPQIKENMKIITQNNDECLKRIYTAYLMIGVENE